MTPEQRDDQRRKNAEKNARRKAAKTDASNKGRRTEARALRRSHGGAFGTETFSTENDTADLIRYGTTKGDK